MDGTGWSSRSDRGRADHEAAHARNGELDYRFLFEAGVQAMLVVAGGRNVVDANPAACEFLGRTREELTAGGLEAIFALGPRLEAALAERRRVGRFEGELLVRRRDRTPTPAEVTIGGYQDGTGADRLGILIQRGAGRPGSPGSDSALSGEKVPDEDAERLRGILDLLPVGIALCAPDGRWMLVNSKLRAMTGYSQEELLAKTWRDLTHPDDLDETLARVRRMLAGEIDGFSVEKRYVRKDYCRIWVELKASVVRGSSGEPRYLVFIVEDVTGRKQAEQMLRALTPREVEVLKLLARGLSNKDIAQHMSFSVGTAKISIERVIAKLGVANRVEAAAFAAGIGLAPTRSSQRRRRG